MRRRRDDIHFAILGSATFETFKYVDSAVTSLSKILPYDVSVRDGGNVNTVIFFTDNVRRDSFGRLRDLIQEFLFPDETIEDAFRKFGNSKCLLITPGYADKVSGVLMVLSNQKDDFEYVKFCFKSTLLRSLGLLGKRTNNELMNDGNEFNITNLDKRILRALYSEELNGKDLEGAVRVLTE